MAINYELLNSGAMTVGGGFNLYSKNPLDARLVIPTLAGLQNLIENAAAYEGMIAYITSEKKHYEVKTIDGVLSYRQFGLTEAELNDIITNATTAAMEFKGVAATLPENPTKGDMYKVSGETIDITIDGVEAKVGDSIVYNGEEWFLIPSGDDIEDTWRPVAGVANDATLTFEAGDKLDVAVASTGNIKYSHEAIAAPTNTNAEGDTKAREYITSLETDGFGHITGFKTNKEVVEDTNTTYEFKCASEHSNVYFTVKEKLNGEEVGEHTVCVDAYNKNETDTKIREAIEALDVTDITGFGAGKTLATLTETDGKIAATFQDIAITKDQVSGFGTMADESADDYYTKTEVDRFKITYLSQGLDSNYELSTNYHKVTLLRDRDVEDFNCVLSWMSEDYGLSLRISAEKYNGSGWTWKFEKISGMTDAIFYVPHYHSDTVGSVDFYIPYGPYGSSVSVSSLDQSRDVSGLEVTYVDDKPTEAVQIVYHETILKSDYYTKAEAATAAQGEKADTAFSWGNHAEAGYATEGYVDDAVKVKLDANGWSHDSSTGALQKSGDKGVIALSEGLIGLMHNNDDGSMTAYMMGAGETDGFAIVEMSSSGSAGTAYDKDKILRSAGGAITAELAFPEKSGTFALTSDVATAKQEAIAAAKEYADGLDHEDTTYTVAATANPLEFTVTPDGKGEAQTVTLVAPTVDTGVMKVTAGTDVVVTPEAGIGEVTVAHKAYQTGTIKAAEGTEEPNFLTSITINNGHVESATVQTLRAALESMTFVFDGGTAAN